MLSWIFSKVPDRINSVRRRVGRSRNESYLLVAGSFHCGVVEEEEENETGTGYL